MGFLREMATIVLHTPAATAKVACERETSLQSLLPLVFSTATKPECRASHWQAVSEIRSHESRSPRLHLPGGIYAECRAARRQDGFQGGRSA